MSPRSYKLGQRQASTEQTRNRILTAARELLMASDGFSSFSIDAVARQADVARMTVYHQFGSKIRLLEALCDSLAASGGMEQLASAFRQPKPLDALNQYILIFARFWEVDRLVMRRLRALAALDPDFEQLIRTRDEWRRKGVRVLAQRIIEKQTTSSSNVPKEIGNIFCPDEVQTTSPNETLDEIVDVLFTLISFETFDTLAGPSRSLEDIAPLVSKLAFAAFTFLL